MGSPVMIVCDGFAADYYGEAVPGSYLIGIERRPGGGVTVLWSDEPDEALVFDDVAAARAFSREDPLDLFRVSFAPAPVPSSPAPPPPRPEPPSPAESVNLANELRAMGLM